jgi:glycosyltransferase involved in cell wall biosynthesis
VRAPRVVHVSPALFGDDGLIGGGERYPLELARAMARRVPTTLLSFSRRPRRERLDDLEIEVIGNWAPFGRFRVDPINPGLFRRLRNADVIHYHQSSSLMASLALIWARRARKPIFTTPHGGGGLWLHRRLGIGHWFTGHLHVSAFSRRVHGQEADPRAQVILGGVDVERFCPDPAAERTGEVLFVGRLLPHKGVNDLIEAVDSETPLRILGRRWRHSHEDYNRRLAAAAAGKRVVFQEGADDAALLAAYRRALCIVLPSVWVTVSGKRYVAPELLGQTLLEGMACGLPAICTDVGGMVEVVEDGVTGFIVPPGEPQALAARIAWLKAHPEQARRMGEAARRRVLERFSWDAVVDRCLQAYAMKDAGGD